MDIVGVIPARFQSKRFPGKPIALLWGKPLLFYVYEQALKSSVLDKVIIATDNLQIQNVAKGFGAPVVMTPIDCPSGSDRVAGVVSDIDTEIVVNIQADQPLLPPQIIEEVTRPLLAQPELVMSTPICPMRNLEEMDDPNIVKVVVDREGFALYFSRSSIPYARNKVKGADVFYKHLGVYAYRKAFLLKYAKFPPSPLERLEGLEQLRVLEYGHRIFTVQTLYDSPCVNTPQDLSRLEQKKVPRIV